MHAGTRAIKSLIYLVNRIFSFRCNTNFGLILLAFNVCSIQRQLLLHVNVAEARHCELKVKRTKQLHGRMHFLVCM